MNELVSVIITTYRRELTLVVDAVNSILEQSYDNIELIIVDDNGVGNEYQIANEKRFLNANNIIYIPNSKNCGAQYSRNIGILMSKGNYVAFLDDDDYWAKEKISKQMKLLKEKDLGMVFCDGMRFISESNKHNGRYQRNPCFSKEITFDMQLEVDYIGSTSQVLIKKECFAQTGLFDLDMKARQDYEMWLRITDKYKVMGVDDILFYYREHQGERISQNPDKCIDSYNKLYQKYKAYYKKNNTAKANLYINLARYYSYKKQYVKCTTLITRAFVLSPRNTMAQINKKLAG